MDRFLNMVNAAFLLGLSVALVTAVTGLEFEPCRTKDNELRADCTFTSSNSSSTAPYCEFLQDGKALGSTEPTARPPPDQGGVSVTMVTPNMCRLSVAAIDEKKASTYTCRVMQGGGQEASIALHPSTIVACSATSVVLPVAPGLLLTVMSLPVLLPF